LLHPNAAKASLRKPNRNALRRLERIASLPPTRQTTLLRTIETFLEVAALKTAPRDSATLNWPTVMVGNGPPC